MGGLSPASRVARESWKPSGYIQGSQGKLETPQGGQGKLEAPRVPLCSCWNSLLECTWVPSTVQRCGNTSVGWWGDIWGVPVPPPLLAPFSPADSRGSQKLLCVWVMSGSVVSVFRVVLMPSLGISPVLSGALPGRLVWLSGQGGISSLLSHQVQSLARPLLCSAKVLGSRGRIPCGSGCALPSLSVSPAACPGDRTAPLLSR